MKTLIKQYGKAILYTVVVLAILAISLLPVPIGESGTQMTLMEYITQKDIELLQRSEKDYAILEKERYPSIELANVKLTEKTKINMKALFISLDGDDNEIDEEILSIKDSEGNSVNVMSDDKTRAIFPYAGIYTAEVSATDTAKDLTTTKTFNLAVDYIPDEVDYEDPELVNYTVNHYLYTLNRGDTLGDTVKYKNDETQEWTLYRSSKINTFVGKLVDIPALNTDDYSLVKMEQISNGVKAILAEKKARINNDSEINLYYMPKTGKITINDNVKGKSETEIRSGVTFSVEPQKIDGYYTPDTIFNGNDYNNEDVTSTNENLDNGFAFQVTHVKYPLIEDVRVTYDGKGHTLKLVPTITGSELYVKVSSSFMKKIIEKYGSNIEDELYKGYVKADGEIIKEGIDDGVYTNVGTYSVDWIIKTPNKEDITGTNTVTIDKATPYLDIDQNATDTCIGGYIQFTFNGSTTGSYETECTPSSCKIEKDGNLIYIKSTTPVDGKVVFSIPESRNYKEIKKSFNFSITNHRDVTDSSNVGPNCITQGTHYYHCSVCGRSGSAANGKYGSHNWQSKITGAGTCVNPSYKFEQCSFCGTIRNKTLYQNNHAPTTKTRGSGTCTDPEYCHDECSYCGTWLKKEKKGKAEHALMLNVDSEDRNSYSDFNNLWRVDAWSDPNATVGGNIKVSAALPAYAGSYTVFKKCARCGNIEIACMHTDVSPAYDKQSGRRMTEGMAWPHIPNYYSNCVLWECNTCGLYVTYTSEHPNTIAYTSSAAALTARGEIKPYSYYEERGYTVRNMKK